MKLIITELGQMINIEQVRSFQLIGERLYAEYAFASDDLTVREVIAEKINLEQACFIMMMSLRMLKVDDIVDLRPLIAQVKQGGQQNYEEILQRKKT